MNQAAASCQSMSIREGQIGVTESPVGVGFLRPRRIPIRSPRDFASQAGDVRSNEGPRRSSAKDSPPSSCDLATERRRFEAIVGDEPGVLEASVAATSRSAGSHRESTDSRLRSRMRFEVINDPMT
jgi:hypothetical protein